MRHDNKQSLRKFKCQEVTHENRDNQANCIYCIVPQLVSPYTGSKWSHPSIFAELDVWALFMSKINRAVYSKKENLHNILIK